MSNLPKDNQSTPLTKGMIVNYKTVQRDSDIYPTSYIQIGIKYCCKEVEEAFDEYYMGFGEYDGTLNQEPKVCLYTRKWDCEYEMPVDYCPFCGKKIQCQSVKTVKEIEQKKEITKTITETIEVDL